MPSCLGMYIEDKLIKYAKVSKEHDNIKVESFGIKFYDKLNEAISQIVSETYSFKIPISINLSEEMYNYFYMFSLIGKKDMQKAIETEFASYCFDKGINENAFESRFILVNSYEDKEKVKAIHIAANKTEINKKMQQLEGNHLSHISPMPISIANIVEVKPKENLMIVNIENTTTVTTIMDEKVYDVDNIEEGSNKILSNIGTKENSYAKAYEICKNTTIYTMEAKELQEEENQYLEYIMPTLYNIVTAVKAKLDESLNKIEKVYITGTASVINNIDLYFQEYLKSVKCEILRPYFVNDISTRINIKDYIEVNSAIALALQGLGEGLKNINFKKPTLSDKIPDFLKIDIGGGKNKDNPSKFNIHIKNDLGEKLTRSEMNLVRTAAGIVLLVLLYSGFSIMLAGQYEKKNQEIAEKKEQAQKEIASVNRDISKLQEKTNTYINLKQNLEDMNNKLAEQTRNKNAIPSFLSQIMAKIPEMVQVTSIENTTGKHIVIGAQSERYEQLGIFVASIKNDEILYEVVSTPGQKEGNIIKIMIEGELP